MLVNAAPPINRPARVRAAARGRGNLCASRRSCLRRPPFPRADAPSRSSRRSPSPRVARVRARPRFWHQLGARAGRALRRRRGIRLAASSTIPAAAQGILLDPQRPPPRPAASRRLPRRPRAERQRRARRGQEQRRLRRREGRRHRRRHDRIEPAAGRRATTSRSRSTAKWQDELSTPSAGCGRTTPAGARRRRSPSSRRSTARSSSPNAATPIPPNGSGRRSGIACNVAPEVFDAAYSLGRTRRLDARRCSPASPIRGRSSAASAPPATRRSIATNGAACRTRSSSRCSIRSSPRCATASTKRPTTPPSRPARSAPNGPRSSACPPGIPIAIGEFDVHYGAIGCGVARGHAGQGHRHLHLRLRRGLAPTRRCADIPGICGIVKGAILPGYYGIEAGQSAVGDIFNWWVEGVCAGDAALHAAADRAKPREQKPGQSGLLALDWNNGNRTILVDQLLTGPAARPDAAHDAGRDLPRADRGDGVRRARDHRAHPRNTACRSTASSAPAASRRRTRCSCRSTPTSPAARCWSPARARPARSARPIAAAVLAGAHPDFAGGAERR